MNAIFNCSNDMAIAADIPQYFPPKRIQQMESDLKTLAEIWSDDTAIYQLDPKYPRPWGWSKATKRKLISEGVCHELLPSDRKLNEIRRLSSRQFAANYLKEMLDYFSEYKKSLIGGDLTYISSIEEVYTYIYNIKNKAPHPSSTKVETTQNVKIIYKSPWSSSGRGVFTSDKLNESTTKKLDGFINKQGGFVADKFYEEKVLDFALEFFAKEDGEVEFIGFSVFKTSDSTNYGYNYVESQEHLKNRILSVFNNEQLLESIITYHKSHLKSSINGAYMGPIGIDMMICKEDGSNKIHPCVEINLRMNMGVLSIILFNKYGEHANVKLTPERDNGFICGLKDGKLMIEYKTSKK